MKQNSKEEIWRDIPEYEDYYEASNLGQIRRLSRTMLTKNGQERFYKGKIMEGSFNKEGYRQVGLSRDGKNRTFLIHQLVAMAFLGHTPDGHTLVVDHINGIKTDNRVENLQIVSQRDNLSTCHRKDRNSLSSDFLGVYRFRNKWTAKIYYNSKLIYLGLFDSEINAAKAYKKALAELKNGTFNPEDYKVKWTSKYKYVSRFRNKWRATPYINGKRIYLGVHTTELEAFQEILEFEAIQPIVNNS